MILIDYVCFTEINIVEHTLGVACSAHIEIPC